MRSLEFWGLRSGARAPRRGARRGARRNARDDALRDAIAAGAWSDALAHSARAVHALSGERRPARNGLVSLAVAQLHQGVLLGATGKPGDAVPVITSAARMLRQLAADDSQYAGPARIAESVSYEIARAGASPSPNVFRNIAQRLSHQLAPTPTR